MDVILFRHGKAEPRGSRLNDDERELIPEGRKKVRGAAFGLRRFLPEYRRVVVWSSRLPRAWQTAEIIAGVLGIKDISRHAFISEGSLNALAGCLSAYGEDVCIIVVGHEPTLSSWACNITRVALPFRKGAAACIRLQAKVPPRGELLWFCQPEELAVLGRGGESPDD